MNKLNWIDTTNLPFTRDGQDQPRYRIVSRATVVEFSDADEKEFSLHPLQTGPVCYATITEFPDRKVFRGALVFDDDQSGENYSAFLAPTAPTLAEAKDNLFFYLQLWSSRLEGYLDDPEDS